MMDRILSLLEGKRFARVAVRITDEDDDWPGRIGKAERPFWARPGHVWVQFGDGEGGEYPVDKLTLLDDSASMGTERVLISSDGTFSGTTIIGPNGEAIAASSLSLEIHPDDPIVKATMVVPLTRLELRCPLCHRWEDNE